MRVPHATLQRCRLITGKEAGELLSVSPECIRQWVRRGYLSPVARDERNRALLYREDHVLEAERVCRSRRSRAPR
ncbi:MerR family transcriptional regulator [Streptomyces syringium]|uniref:MerR family transcriptional regulator n=1 Tax=Streptomyces syringium TaxID=76729 RepID=UPI0033EC5A76